jgi:hypothetical protein
MTVGAGITSALVVLLLVTTSAFAALVSTIQGESMTESSASVAPFTCTDGLTMMRWSSDAGTTATATANFNVAQP